MSITRHAAVYLILAAGFLPALTGDSDPPAGDEIFARVEAEAHRRQSELTRYSGARQYRMQNARFGKEATVGLRMNYRQLEGERYTVLTRSGSVKLGGIIDKVLESEAGASMPRETIRHQITSANYRFRLLPSEVTAGRRCYVLELTPRSKSRFLLFGKAWVDAESYGVVRIEGQFAASMSILVGAPRMVEEFAAVRGFWMPAHVRCATSSFLLGPTELDISFSDYHLDPDPEGKSRPDGSRGLDSAGDRNKPEGIPLPN